MTNWKDIHPDFAYHGYEWETNYQQQWTNHGFTYEQTKEWIDIGLQPTDSGFAIWLEREGYTALAVLNEEDADSLREEYQISLNNPQSTPINPVNNWPWKLIIVALGLVLITYYLIQ